MHCASVRVRQNYDQKKTELREKASLHSSFKKTESETILNG